MAYGLPVRGQSNWDDELNNSMESLHADVQSAQADASAARNDASYAKSKSDEAAATANGVAANTDSQTAYNVQHGAATQAALNASLVSRAAQTLSAAEKLQVRTNLDAGRASVANPYDFGAVGDGTTSDTTAVQNAYNSLASAGGGTLIIPNGARFSIPGGIDATSQSVSIIHQGGVLVGGEIRVGNPSATTNTQRDFSQVAIRILLDRADAYGTGKGIKIRDARFLTISGSIINAGKAISVDQADGATGFHTVGMIQIESLQVQAVNYGIYTNTAAWDTCSDWKIVDFRSNYALICPIWMSGCDDLAIESPTMLMLSGSSTDETLKAARTHNIYIGKTNHLNIIGGQLFEAGKSAIYVGEVDHFNITGNHLVWPGQEYVGDCIEIHGVAGAKVTGTITGNTSQRWTRAAIGLYGPADFSQVNIEGNAYNWFSPFSQNQTGVTLTNANTFRVYVDPASAGRSPQIRDYTPNLDIFDSVKGTTKITARDQKTYHGGVAAAGGQPGLVSVTAATAIFNLKDFRDDNVYDGIMIVQARNSLTNGAKTASYVLHISSDTQSGRPGARIAQISALGWTAGATSGSPSFTWTVVSDQLVATPIGSTSGSFYFEAYSVGSLLGY